MKKIKLFGVMLLTLLFSVVCVNAEEEKVIGGVYKSIPDNIAEGYKAYRIMEGEHQFEYVVAKESDIKYDIKYEYLTEEYDNGIQGFFDAWDKLKKDVDEALAEYDKQLAENPDDEELLKEKEQLVQYFNYQIEYMDTIKKYNIIDVCGIAVTGLTPDGFRVSLSEINFSENAYSVEGVKLPEAIEVEFNFSKELPEIKEGMTRKFYAIGFHLLEFDDTIQNFPRGATYETNIIDEVDVEEAGKAKFKSDKFSIFTLVYEDVETPKEEVKTDVTEPVKQEIKNADTFDGIVDYVILSVVSLAFIFVSSLYIKKKYN